MSNIDGTAGADLLFGAATDDLIAGKEQRDIIYGGAGNDTLLGGEGDDVLRGESGNDRIEGGAGNDDLSSTDQGDDILIGGEGNDLLVADRSHAGDALVLDGGAGNDRLVIQLLAATDIDASAGEGDDTVDIFAIRNTFTLSLGLGRDVVNVLNFQSSVQGGGGRIVISDFEAGVAGDRISLNGILTQDFRGWNPNMNPFGAGYLKAAQAGADVVVSASFAANGAFVEAIVLRGVLLSSLTPENLGGWTIDGSLVPPVLLVGTGAAETLQGNGGADDIDGQDGDDILEGNGGADLLKGGDGNDILRGGFGNDRLYGGSGNDSLSAGGGEDSLYGEDGDDTLVLSLPFGTTAASLFGSGGSGRDTITIAPGSSAATFVVDAGSGDDLVTIASLAGTATIALGEGRDRIEIDTFNKSTTSAATIEISDFATGDDGDRLNWTGFLMRTLSGLTGDPFASGFTRLLQTGADAVLQIDRNGGGDQFVTLITFKNSDAGAFTAYNLGGFAPDGAPVTGSTITGTGDSDLLLGTDGDDVIEGGDGKDILLGFHGDDTIRGGGGNDSISGYDGDDILEGGDGDDTFSAGRGDDLIDGGEGNDLFDDFSGSGSKGFVGGAGDDRVHFRRFDSHDILVAAGGDGDDYFTVSISGLFGSFAIDGGAGNDVFNLSGNGDVTLGAGVDHVRFVDTADGGPGVFVHDFLTGDSGDRMSFEPLIGLLSDFDPSANPFASGHLKLVASGSDTVLILDADGASGSGAFVGVATLLGIDMYSLTSRNIGGYALPFATGTAADETFQGGAGSDDFTGGGGDDTFLIGYGGDDKAVGGTGNDLFFVATGLYGPAPRSVSITGGGGSDTLQVQSQLYNYELILRSGGAPSFNAIDATGIGTVEFLSGFDASRGWAPGIPLQYRVTIEDGFAAPGGPLVLDTTGLAPNEVFSLYAANLKDQDVSLRLIGGAGIDRFHAGAGGSYLEGGAGNDELYTGLGDDTLLGGEGADLLNADVGYSRSGVDLLDGGAGDDRLQLVAGYQGSWTSVTLLGGEGNDSAIVKVQGGISTGVASIDLGTGNDRLELQAATGTYNVTLGSGSDRIEIRSGGIAASVGPDTSISIADFDPGPGGDTVTWGAALNAYLAAGYVAFQNPFRTGHARLLQDGADVLVQFSRLNAGSYVTLLRLQNHLIEDFNGGIGGFSTFPLNGTPQADILTGTVNGDFAYGLADDDLFRLEQGGVDHAEGGDGDDVFYFGADFSQDTVLGGAGADEIVAQGSGSSRFTGISGVETITLLTAADLRFGAATTSSNIGFLLTTADASVAAGGLLSVNGATLLGADTLVFNGASELDGRFSVSSGAGADQLTGGAGNDVLRGGAGSDTLVGGGGNDQLFGEEGDDVLNESGSGSDLVSGGEGADQITITRGSLSSDLVTASGGAGADRFTVSMTGSTLALDAGEGDDFVTLKSNAKVAVTLGSGKDTIDLSQFVRTAGIPEILDFQGGAGGDAISWGNWLSLNTYGWDGQGDPFQKGYLRLAQKGADVHLQLNAFGRGGLSSPYETILVFRNVDKASLTAANLGGYAPLTLNGTDAAETLTGTQGDDVIGGGGGDDLLLVHQGGTDTLRGGEGNDRFFFGRQLPSWQVGDTTGLLLDGGAGTDTVILQGSFFNGWSVPTTGIERLKLLSGTDNSFGTGGAKIELQNIMLRDLDIPGGTTLAIDASGLLAGERATVDARYESDGALVFLGGAGDDVVTPGRGQGTIYGGAGNDSLDGIYGGKNSFYGEAGNDTAYGWGDSLLDGGEGDDFLQAGDLGLDTLIGGAGNDVIRLRGLGTPQLTNATASGGDGNDLIELDTYYPGVVSIDGGTGNDVVNITGAKGAITIALGQGQDVFKLNNPQYVLRTDTTLAITDFAAGTGGDRFDWAPLLATGLAGYQPGSNPFLTGHARVAQSGADTLVQIDRDGSGQSYAFTTYVTLQGVNAASLNAFNLGFAAQISGGSGNDSLTGTSGADWIEGGAGDDSIDGGAGSDRMAGGTGNDVYVVDSDGDAVTEYQGEGNDTVRTSLASYSLAGLAHVENITGTSASGQVLTGNAANNLVNAGGGNDFLYLWVGGGDDVVNAGAGFDNMFFGATLTAADVVNGGAGYDTLVVQGPYGSLRLSANVTEIENLSILGGNNTNFGEPGTNRYDYVLTTQDVNFAAGVQARINGAALLEGEDFTFDGSAETDGSFVVYGGKGVDTLTGGLGHDIFFYAEERFASGDKVNGGAGYDGMFLRGNYTIDFNAPGYTGLFTNIENLTLTSATDERYARGGGTEFDYSLTLSDAIVNPGHELTVSGALLMATETMVLDASQESDGSVRLFGGKSADTLKGGANADLLHGNLGGDMLAGNGGADSFRYQSAAESNSASMDRILDFTPGTDKIELERIDANALIGGNQAFSWIGANAFSGAAGQLRAYENSGSWFAEGDANGDGLADLVIGLTLQGTTQLSAGDFVL
jgi:Ca2+-binding RTX toxin-like protein